MSSKVQRQQLIAKLVSSQTVTSQPQLRELLQKKGIAATQATVSRDLEDLGAVKVRTAAGDLIYFIFICKYISSCFCSFLKME